MRKIFVCIFICVGIFSNVGFSPLVAQADSSQSVVLIDSGVNDALFAKNIAYEACFIEYTTCSNGKNSMEGPGAAQQVHLSKLLLPSP